MAPPPCLSCPWLDGVRQRSCTFAPSDIREFPLVLLLTLRKFSFCSHSVVPTFCCCSVVTVQHFNTVFLLTFGNSNSNARSVAWFFRLNYNFRRCAERRLLSSTPRRCEDSAYCYVPLRPLSRTWASRPKQSARGSRFSLCSVFCTIIDDAPRFPRTSTAISCRFRHNLKLSLFGNRHSLCFHIRWYSEEIADSSFQL